MVIDQDIFITCKRQHSVFLTQMGYLLQHLEEGNILFNDALNTFYLR